MTGVRVNRRRAGVATLAAGLAPTWLLSACEPVPDGPDDPPRWGGNWVGGDSARGHRLRDPEVTANREPDTSTTVSVVIVGAGVAGLAAARALRLAGIDDFVLLDLESEAGGNARGHRMGSMACPLGAHYLPVPDDRQPVLRDWLSELGLMTHRHGRWQADARHRCHAPQERLWFDGRWHEGLLPPAEAATPRAQSYRRFADAVSAASKANVFAMSMRPGAWTVGLQALDAVTFGQWLASQGLDDTALLGYLDYACRDDFGAGLHTVSAWAGLHYFASRHGFRAPVGDGDDGDDGQGDDDDAGVFTWPEGNARLTRALAGDVGARLRPDQLVVRVVERRHHAEVDALVYEPAAKLFSATPNPDGTVGPTPRRIRYLARHVIVAAPLHVAARIVDAPPSARLREAATAVAHAPWLVANLHLRGPLDDATGAAPAWDNVLFNPAGTSDALGYVDASHQQLSPLRGATVLTSYWALGRDGASMMRQQRRALLEQPWQGWSRRVVADLVRAHPDLPAQLVSVDLMRYGHAMAIPRPGTRGLLERLALHRFDRRARVHPAHSDLAGYSVFEMAFALGHAAGQGVAAALGRRVTG